jgi:hypothetical protein
MNHDFERVKLSFITPSSYKPEWMNEHMIQS